MPFAIMSLSIMPFAIFLGAFHAPYKRLQLPKNRLGL